MPTVTKLGVLCCVLAATGCAAERWRWPEGSPSVRIDTKVRFADDDDFTEKNNSDNNVQADESPETFKQPSDTEGFYNRPPGSGRYPVRVESHSAPYRVENQNVYPVRNIYRPNRNQQHASDGTLDSLQYCKCVPTPECEPQNDLPEACGAGKFLCCYRRPNKIKQQKTEFFNEVEDERPMLYPSKENIGGPFLQPPDAEPNGVYNPGHGTSDDRQIPEVLVGPGGPTGKVGPPKRPVLVGPEGPTGVIGPQRKPNVLVGPDGPTGVVGPPPAKNQGRDILVGPEGPTGLIGPAKNHERGTHSEDTGPSETAQRGILVGPGGPTGFIGPEYRRGVLVGPGGPTGYIGPGGGQRPGILVGPEGPTGMIGPGGYAGYGRQSGQPGILVGPGGPTGIIGPGRHLLVGPGGPTGQIGPRRGNYFGN